MTLSSAALLESLGAPLRERVRVVNDAAPAPASFVLYWMRTAARGHENPALDTAIAAANALGLPAFVYHALSERYPYASDRHHVFALEGARDAAREVTARGVGYAFHLERPGARGAYLHDLAKRAALVVTEDMPVAPLASWTAAVAAETAAPVWCVDTACVAPLPLVGRAYDRAFAFRDKVRPLQLERMARPWVDVEPVARPFVPELPFVAVDLEGADLAALVAECAIDHGVAPVPESKGGARAGYARWEAFKAKGLARYGRDRNDPVKAGVSRLSPYLHYGHVSPLRIAREAAAAGGDGAAKFLDELLVWRELAYAFCRFRPDHDTLWAIPPWARESLRKHEADARERHLSWETLARGRTDDPLWDAAQRSLLIHGELHNNLRMTWGKALVGWTRTADEALGLLVDLNHRYALDGRDPASYGGLLWCLGQFDRPFRPETKVFGLVRPQGTRQHARRIDLPAYAERTRRPARRDAQAVAVVGAGIAGLACARTLHDHGLRVRVFDKGRMPGGRAATRREEGRAFDHGAQYFTAQDRHFARFVGSWCEQGLVAPWPGRVGVLEGGSFVAEHDSPVRYVGVPGMGRLAAHLAADLDLKQGGPVVGLDREGEVFRLRGAFAEDLGTFDAVLLAVPAPQAVPLLGARPRLADAAAAANLRPAWAVLLDFATDLALPFDAAFVKDSPLVWIARDSGKPGRAAGERWVVHASPAWSEAHLWEDEEDVAWALARAFARLTARDDVPLFETAHRWRFALPDPSLGVDCLFDPDLRLGACGDWCLAPRVEGAFLSGVALGGRLLGMPEGPRLPAARGAC